MEGVQGMVASSTSAESMILVASGSPRWVLQQLLRDREGLLECIFERTHLKKIALILLLSNAILLSAYGAMMGLSAGWEQLGSSALKLPLLYLFSLLICFPVLYVINALMGSRLGVLQAFTMILVALGLNSLLLGCFAPIVLFFVCTGADYHFLKLLHVGIMTFSGFWAMGSLYRGLVSMCDHSAVYPRLAVRILLLWIMVFGFVGTQMAWTLRPFLGAPDMKFELLRHDTNGNFYQAVWQSIKNL
jgi:hypothetical protein